MYWELCYIILALRIIWRKYWERKYWELYENYRRKYWDLYENYRRKYWELYENYRRKYWDESIENYMRRKYWELYENYMKEWEYVRGKCIAQLSGRCHEFPLLAINYLLLVWFLAVPYYWKMSLNSGFCVFLGYYFLGYCLRVSWQVDMISCYILVILLRK